MGRLGIPREALANNTLQRGSFGLAACATLKAAKFLLEGIMKKPRTRDNAARKGNGAKKLRERPADIEAPRITPTTAPSAEWLTEMVMKRVEAATEEYRQGEWESLALSNNEILLHEASVILSHYRMARLAIEIASGKARDPLRLEEMFTEEEIENGVEFGSKQRPGWPEIVTGYDTRSLALKALKDWVDWEQSSGPEGARHVPRKMNEVPGANGFDLDYANGEEWLKWNSTMLGGWRSCRDVYLMRWQFLQYEEGLKWEKEAKEQWEKRRKKVLGEASGKKTAGAGKKVVQLGKSTQAKSTARKRLKTN